MARKLKIENTIRKYLFATALGFILLFISDQAVSLIVAPYPPFGLVSVASMSLASYLVLIGLYYSAISISNDIELQKTISSVARREFNLLNTIGAAEKEGRIQRVVGKIVKEQAKNLDTQSERNGTK
jgi:hypothetical protein